MWWCPRFMLLILNIVLLVSPDSIQDAESLRRCRARSSDDASSCDISTDYAVSLDRNILNPTKVNISGVVAVAAGDKHSLFLLNDGLVFATGHNAFGQLGDGTTTDQVVPVRVQLAGPVLSIAASWRRSLFVLRSGAVYVCGHYADGTATDRLIPVLAFPTPRLVRRGYLGWRHALLLTEDSEAFAVGHNGHGRLGVNTLSNPDMVDHYRPTKVTLNQEVHGVAAGEHHTLLLAADGTALAVGHNGNGRLGDGSLLDRATLTRVLQQILRVAAGAHHSLFLRMDGIALAAGNNGNGRLGDGTTVDRHNPVRVPLAGLADVAAGEHHSLFLTREGLVHATGHNQYGQLGDSTTIDRHSPVPVPLAEVSGIAAGSRHSLFMLTDGSVYAAGHALPGQLGIIFR